jgi:glycosyltransferase involved in cell wall biosynthesis
MGEIRRVRTEMDCFAPDAWLVYGASATNPDLFGWWMSHRRAAAPQKYVLLATDLGSGKRIPLRWRNLYLRAHHRSLARCDAISAYHPSSRNDLIRHGIPEEKLSLLPPAVSPWEPGPDMQEARQLLGLPTEGPLLFCASRFPDLDEGDAGKMNMLLELISASTALPPEALLVIAGDGPGRSALEREIASLSRRCSIRLVGAVEHSKMPLYYAACDFFVYPHRVNRPWLAVLEAQSCGRPVVTMRTQSAELTVQPGQTGLLATNTDEFRYAIAALAANRERTREMGRAASGYITENHSIDIRIDQIERMLETSRTDLPDPVRQFSGFQETLGLSSR